MTRLKEMVLIIMVDDMISIAFHCVLNFFFFLTKEMCLSQ